MDLFVYGFFGYKFGEFCFLWWRFLFLFVDVLFLCSLEEFYLGCKKKCKVIRIVFDVRGWIKEVEEILMIKVKFGWKIGI